MEGHFSTQIAGMKPAYIEELKATRAELPSQSFDVSSLFATLALKGGDDWRCLNVDRHTVNACCLLQVL